MQSEIEGRATNQRRQPWHLFGFTPPRIETSMQTAQFLLNEGMADFQRMPLGFHVDPGMSQFRAKILERLFPHIIREGGWPNPRDRERRLTPTVGALFQGLLGCHSDSRAGDVRNSLRPELEWDAIHEGEVIKIDS